jgi:hypothetical protein
LHHWQPASSVNTVKIPMQNGDTPAAADAKSVEALVRAAMPLFRGKPKGVQGAALADLLAMWLAGHLDPNDPEGEKTQLIREAMLEMHLVAVRALVPLNYKSQIEPQLKPKH